MFLKNKPEHALITIYGDNENQDITQAVSLYLKDFDIKFLSPDSPETLTQAAQNSVLTFIGLKNPEDPNLTYGRVLQSNKLVVGDIIAFFVDDPGISPIKIMGRGFDACVNLEDTRQIEFKKFLSHKINRGAERLSSLIKEEEFRRFNDALSISPTSMIIFDADKRAVFVSDHYFRAYPKIAPRLIRGLRVYDAFEMMIAEEGIGPDDARYNKIKKFWYNLNDNVEFTLDDGTAYRMKAVQLPGGRGTVVTGQNVTGYLQYRKKEQLKDS